MIDGVELDYRTREQSDPRGKAKVFFACHTDDFSQAFKLIVDDVLEHANCAVWYETRLADGDDAPLPKEAEKAFSDILDDMQLVVVAVTTHFLREPCRAREVVLTHALKAHIPVLPIMLERGLEYEFNERCAPIQVVNRYVDDPTATPYDEVIDTFLSSVIVGDELARRVRDAFDAYVFLSYRKKDRRHAQRLMRLIHENEDFRDIAIWYDEYLVPGEEFDAAIRAAFDKSSIFALAVTPNLLQQGNYVMEIEYPLAHDRRDAEPKRFDIVPVEMHDPKFNDPRTDLDQLKKDYKEIPPVRDEQVRVEVNTAFIESLRKVAHKAGDGSPRHRFFIGLAYLNGIDVVPNRKRALELLEGAAKPKDPEERPCIEASETLVDMYLTGDGVIASLDSAIQWQSTAVSQWRDEYDRGHDPDEHRGLGTSYFKALMRLSDLYREDEQADEAITVAEDALAFADELVEEVGVREMDRDMAVILGRLGGLYREKRQLGDAERCYRRAVRIYERLASDISTVRARRDLSISYERLGDLRRRQRDFTGAEGLYGKALGIRKGLISDIARPQERRDLSSVLTKLGNIRNDQDDLSGACNYYEQAAELDRVLAGELRTTAARDDWYVSLVKLGDIRKQQRSLAEALQLYNQAREGFEQLATKLATPRYVKAHARTLGKLASALKYVAREDATARPEADQRFRETIASWEDIRSTDASDDVLNELAAAHYNYALFSKSRDEARAAVELWSDLATRDPRYRRYVDGTRKQFGL